MSSQDNDFSQAQSSASSAQVRAIGGALYPQPGGYLPPREPELLGQVACLRRRTKISALRSQDSLPAIRARSLGG